MLFSSIRAADMNMGATSARGVAALKEYLHLAEYGRTSGVLAPSGDHDSPFEAEVCRALRDSGWEVHAQVGSAGFFIDLAVVDPMQPGRYLVGIECDGATYHSSPTARDRDRLRQQVLEDLGWTIVRIWSTDWYRRPEMTLNRVLERITVLKDQAATLSLEEAVVEEIVADLAGLPAENAAPIPAQAESNDALPIQPYTVASLRSGKSQKSLPEIPPGVLANIVTRVVQIEAPMHVDEMRRVIASFFATRATKRTQEQIDLGIQAAIAQGHVVQRAAFLWSPGVDAPPVRFRGDDCPVVAPELIAPEELQEAVKLALAREFGLRQDALISSTSRLLGFRRCGTNLEAAIGVAITELCTQSAIAQDAEGFLILHQAGASTIEAPLR
jgi:very-short-patch-repair endonuclease